MTLERRLYRCEHCPKAFLTDLALRGHRSTHNEEAEP